MRIDVGTTMCKVSEYSTHELVWCKDYLVFEVEGARFTPAYKHGYWDGKVRLFNKECLFPIGLLQSVIKAGKEQGFEIDVHDRRVAPCVRDETADVAWLRPYQRTAVNLAVRHVNGLFWIATGAGKCLGKGTPVIRYDGSVVPVESVRLGDKLMGPDSQPRQVAYTTQGCGPLYRIRPIKGKPWICNDVHVLTLVHTQTSEVIDIPLNEYIKKPAAWKHMYKLFQPGVITFEKKDKVEVDPYFLGVWYGDGKRNLDQGVQVSKPDAEIYQVCVDIAKNYRLTVHVDTYNSCPTYRIVGARGSSNPLLDAMRRVVKDVQHLPAEYMTASIETRSALLAGLLDTGGNDSKGYWEITQERAGFAADIAFLARSLGLRVTEKEKLVKGKIYYKLTIIGDTTFLPIRIARKTTKKRKQKKNALRTGFSVEFVGDGDYYGFTLSGDGRFLLGDFTVTHNTEIFCAIAHSLPCRWLFVAHRKELMHQAAERYEKRTGEKPGLIGDGHWDTEQRVTFATFQTLAKALDRQKGKPDEVNTFLSQIGGLCVDEAHTLGADSFWTVAMACKNAYYRFGLSGTPLARGDKRSIYTVAALGPVIWRLRSTTLIDAGVLSAPKIKMVECRQTEATDQWQKVYKELIVTSKQRNKLVCEIALRAEKPCLVFVKQVDHGEVLTKAFRHLGMNADFVWGDKDTLQRKTAIKALERADLDVLVCSVVFQEGVDIPDLRSVVIAAGGKSTIATIQMIGRGMRKAAGKEGFEVWDVLDRGCKWTSTHARQRYNAYVGEGHEVTVLKETEFATASSGKITK